MFNYINRCLLFAFLTLSCAFVVSAQRPSLATLGTDKYVSGPAGFEISVPHQCMTTSTANGLQNYICDVKEGRVTVIVSPTETTVKTEADLTAFINAFDDSPLKSNGMKLLTEGTIKVGTYRGIAVKLEAAGDTFFLVSLYSVGRPTYVVSARSLAAVPDSAKLIADAFASFNFISPRSN
jgi:hypothetical protein